MRKWGKGEWKTDQGKIAGIKVVVIDKGYEPELFDRLKRPKCPYCGAELNVVMLENESSTDCFLVYGMHGICDKDGDTVAQIEKAWRES